MKALVRSWSIPVLLTLVAPAVAAEEPPKEADPMAAWHPPKAPADEKDRKEIMALFGKLEAAGKKGDLEAATALVDFPVLMVTDDAKGEAVAGPWTKEQWTEMMKPYYAKPMGGTVAHKANVFVVTDSLAVATDNWKMTMGKKTMTGRNSTLFVRKGGEWKIKAMMEGGWGDMPMPDQAQAASGK